MTDPPDRACTVSAYRKCAEFRGAAIQLAIDLGALVIAGILVEEVAFRRRRGTPVKTASRTVPPA